MSKATKRPHAQELPMPSADRPRIPTPAPRRGMRCDGGPAKPAAPGPAFP